MNGEFIDIVRDYRKKFSSMCINESIELQALTKNEILRRMVFSFREMAINIQNLFLSNLTEREFDKDHEEELLKNFLDIEKYINGYNIAKIYEDMNTASKCVEDINKSYNFIYNIIHRRRLQKELSDEEKKYVKNLEDKFYFTENSKIKEFNEMLKKDGIETQIEIEDE